MGIPNFWLIYINFVLSFVFAILSLKSTRHWLKSVWIGLAIANFSVQYIMAIYYVGASR